jgi:hypothetical protein
MIWTKESVEIEAQKYTTLNHFHRGNCEAYMFASMNGYLDEICRHMLVRKVWCKDAVLAEAKKFSSIGEFRLSSMSAYNSAVRNGWLVEFTWLSRKNKKPSSFAGKVKKGSTFWIKENVISEAVKYKTKTDFAKGSPGAYQAALKNKWLGDCQWLQRPINVKWTNDRVSAEATKYKTKSDFAKGSTGAYLAALRNGWLDQFSWEQKLRVWTKEAVALEAKKYGRRARFQQGSPSAYRFAYKNGYLDEICQHMRVFLGR